MNNAFPSSASDSRTRDVAFLELHGEPAGRCFLYRPGSARAGAPLVVSVHGIARNAAAHVYRLMADAERMGVCILAPLFEKAWYGQYQQLVDARTGVRSDLALIDMIQDVERLTGADGSRLLMLGYSGGAQFAHRFVMAHPERVVSAALAAAGWYTMPDQAVAYPLGLDCSASAPALHLDPDAFLGTPVHVLVGDLDIARDSSLRRSDILDQSQGRTRVARAQKWVAAMNAAAVSRGLHMPADFQLLRGVGHNFSDAVENSNLAKLAFEHFVCDAAPGRVKKGDSHG